MKISRNVCLGLALTALCFAGQAAEPTSTITQETASAVLSHWRALPRNTHFEKWTYEMWAFNAGLCQQHSGQKSPSDLAAFKPQFSGSFSLPRSIPGMCSALAQGPKPICYGFNSRQHPFTMPHSGLPSDYSFVGYKAIANGKHILVSGYCQLVMNAQDTQQLYVGPAVFRWKQTLAPRSMNTASGPRTLLVGNAEFESSAPGVHAVLVVGPLGWK